MKFVLTTAATSLLLHGCASSDDTRVSTVPSDAGKNANAHPAAYGITDAFSFGKPQKVRPANELKFYYKDCGQTDPEGDRAYFSKTAYSCSGPR